MPILNFLTICTKLRLKTTTNLSVGKLLVKGSKPELPLQKNFHFPIQKNQLSIRASISFYFQKTRLIFSKTLKNSDKEGDSKNLEQRYFRNISDSKVLMESLRGPVRIFRFFIKNVVTILTNLN